MNFALPALVCFVVLLPGFIARSRFRHVENKTLDYSPFGEVVATAVIVAALLHALWVWLSAKIFGWQFQPLYFLQLLSGDSKAQLNALDRVAQQAGLICSYIAAVYATSFFAPWLVKLMGSWNWLSNRAPFVRSWFRFSDAPWYYLLSGADLAPEHKKNAFIYISAVVNLAGQPHLYKGVLEKYYLNRDGSLDRMILFGVARRPISKDKQQNDSPNSSGDPHLLKDERFYEVEGDYFVLRYAEAITLNIQVLEFIDSSEEAEEAVSSGGDAAGASGSAVGQDLIS